MNKPLAGHFKKAGTGAFYYIKEFRVEDFGGYELGQEVTLNLFKPGDVVDVTGLGKGKGFTGVINAMDFTVPLVLMELMNISVMAVLLALRPSLIIPSRE